jgi:hypothetical protein
VIAAWAPNLNIVIGDGVDGSYISSIATLNSDPTRGG